VSSNREEAPTSQEEIYRKFNKEAIALMLSHVEKRAKWEEGYVVTLKKLRKLGKGGHHGHI